MRVNLPADAVLARLRENRDAHAKFYAEAFAAYREQWMVACQAELNAVRQDKRHKPNSYIARGRLEVPESHTDAYDIVIAMLLAQIVAAASADGAGMPSFELDEGDFRRFWQDDWDWSGKFHASNATYGVGSRPER